MTAQPVPRPLPPPRDRDPRRCGHVTILHVYEWVCDAPPHPRGKNRDRHTYVRRWPGTDR